MLSVSELRGMLSRVAGTYTIGNLPEAFLTLVLRASHSCKVVSDGSRSKSACGVVRPVPVLPTNRPKTNLGRSPSERSYLASANLLKIVDFPTAFGPTNTLTRSSNSNSTGSENGGVSLIAAHLIIELTFGRCFNWLASVCQASTDLLNHARVAPSDLMPADVAAVGRRCRRRAGFKPASTDRMTLRPAGSGFRHVRCPAAASSCTGRPRFGDVC